MEIQAVHGDITKETVDAIVNAANERLRPGGGVCGAIHSAGGPDIAQECAAIGHCPTGDAVATGAGRLPARFVIHAVGPVWQGGGAREADLLASAYRRSLEVAASVGAHSVAFPAISTGIYGYPLVEATDVAVAAVRGWDGEGIDLVRFACFDDPTLGSTSKLVARCSVAWWRSVGSSWRGFSRRCCRCWTSGSPACYWGRSLGCSAVVARRQWRKRLGCLAAR